MSPANQESPRRESGWGHGASARELGKAGSDHGRPEGSRARVLRPKTAEGSVEISVLVGDGRRTNRAMGGSGSSAKTDLTGEGLANVFFYFV